MMRTLPEPTNCSKIAYSNNHTILLCGICALHIGVGLEIKFWFYVSMHVLCIHEARSTFCGQDSSLEMDPGKKVNFNNLCIWVWVCITRIPKCQLKDDAQKENFLDCDHHTNYLIMWYDEDLERIKIVTCCTFDKGFNAIPIKSITPNVQQLIHTTDGEYIAIIDSSEIDSNYSEFFANPFTEKKKLTSVPVLPSNTDNCFGFLLTEDKLYLQTHVKELVPDYCLSKVFKIPKHTRKKTMSKYLCRVHLHLIKLYINAAIICNNNTSKGAAI